MDLPRIPDRLVRPLKWAGYPAFAVVAFVVSLWATLPRDRIKDLLETDASALLGADVSANDFGLTLFTGPGVSTGSMIIKTRPTDPGDKPARIGIDDLTIHFSLYSMMRGWADATFKVHAAHGAITGKYRAVPDETTVGVDATGVTLGDLPHVAEVGGLPLEGVLDLKIGVTAVKGRMVESAGEIDLTLVDGAVGDGKAKLVVPGGDPFLSQGVTVPKIALGRIGGKVVIEKGRASLKSVHGHSKDLDLELDGSVDLRDPITLSALHLYLKAKPSEALLKREAVLEMVVNGAAGTAKRPDGWLGFSIGGTLGAPIFLPAKDAPIGLGAPTLAPQRLPLSGRPMTPRPPRFVPAMATTTGNTPEAPPPPPPPPMPSTTETPLPPPSPMPPIQAMPTSTMVPSTPRFGGPGSHHSAISDAVNGAGEGEGEAPPTTPSTSTGGDTGEQPIP